MYLGVEIGGTKLQVGICDARGRVNCLACRPVARRAGRAGILRQLQEMVPDLLDGVRGIGVGFGGPVDVAEGRVVKSHQVAGWSGFQLRKWFWSEFGLPVTVENDSHCAGLAEATLGAGRGNHRVFYFNVGTGIGGALVMDGKIYSGRLGAMEFGHTWVDGHRLEDVASGLAIERGVSTVAQSGRYVGAALANAVTLLNPDIVVVGGGVSLAGEKFFRPLRLTARRLVLPVFRDNLRIVPAALGEAVVVGAAMLAKEGECRMKSKKKNGSGD
jgi:glucokinase